MGKVAVVIQGGAMRSIYCAGAIRGLLEGRHLDDLAAIVCSSAGCVSGLALAASGGSAEAFSTLSRRLLDRITGPEFINRRRLGCIVDVDYLVVAMLDVFEISESTFDWLDSYEVSMTTSEGSPVYVELKGLDLEGVREALVATMAIPLLYGKRAFFRGERFFDGGISDPLPIVRACEIEGVERIFGISNVMQGRIGRRASTAERCLLNASSLFLPSGVRLQALALNALGQTADRLLSAGHLGGVALTRISPSEGSILGGRLDNARGHLERLDDLGYRDARRIAGA